MNKITMLKSLITLVTQYIDDNYNDENLTSCQEFYDYLKEIKLLNWLVYVIKPIFQYELYTEYIRESQQRIDKNMMSGEAISDYLIKNKKRFFLTKGFVLSAHIYRTPYAREFSDIDIFCSNEDIYEISTYIESLGYINSTKLKLSKEIGFKDYLNYLHYRYDNENMFWDSRSNVLVEVKTGDYFAHGGFDDKQTEMIFQDPSAVVETVINGYSFPVLNTEYTFLMLVSNTYRNFNTRSGQVIDFKIRDLIDLIFFLKAHNMDSLTAPVRELFIKFNKMYELCIVLKYTDRIFGTAYIKNFIEKSGLREGVEAAALYTPIEDVERFVCDTEYRVYCMEQNLCTRLKAHLDGKMAPDYVQCRYSFKTTKLFNEIYGQGLFLSVSHRGREVAFQFWFDRTKAAVPFVLSVDLIHLAYGDRIFKYAAVLKISKGEICFQENPLNMTVSRNQNGFVLQGVIPEDCLYKGWMSFVAMGYYFGVEWTDYACRLAEPDNPTSYYLGI